MTVVIGSAMDIVTWCRVPRYLHNNLPLGNPLGEPGDRQSQRRSVEHALRLASDMSTPGVEVADIPWKGRDDWPQVYGRVTSPTVVVRDGGTLDGECAMAPAEAAAKSAAPTATRQTAPPQSPGRR